MKERRGPSPFLSALFSFPLPPRLLSFSTIFYLLRVPRPRRFCSSPLFFSSFFRPRTPGIQRCWTVATQQAIVQLFLAGTPKVRYISGAAIRGPLRDVTRWRLVRPNLPLFPPGFLNTVFPKAAHPPPFPFLVSLFFFLTRFAATSSFSAVSRAPAPPHGATPKSSNPRTGNGGGPFSKSRRFDQLAFLRIPPRFRTAERNGRWIVISLCPPLR